MFLLVNNRPIQSADSIGFWPIVSVSADSQNSTIGRPLRSGSQHSIKIFTTWSVPLSHAKWNGVFPSLFWALTLMQWLTEDFNSNWIIFKWWSVFWKGWLFSFQLKFTRWCRIVCPLASGILKSIPLATEWSNSNWTLSMPQSYQHSLQAM